MERFNIKYLVHTAAITALGILIMILGTMIPFLNFLTVLIPVPYIIIGVKDGELYSVVSLIVTSMVVALAVNVDQGVFFLCTAGAPALAISYCIKNKFSFSKTMVIGSIGTVLSLVAIYMILVELTGISMFQIIDEQIKMFTSGGFLNQLPNPDETMEMLKEKILVLKILFPSMVITIAIIQTYIYVIVSRFLLIKSGYELDKVKTLSFFSIPNSFIGGAIIMTLLSYGMDYLNIVDGNALSSNLLYVGYLAMVVQGLAVLSFILEKRGIGNTLRRVIIGVTFVLGGFFNLILATVGMFEIVMDIRKIHKEKQ